MMRRYCAFAHPLGPLPRALRIRAQSSQRYGRGLSYYLGTNLLTEGLAWFVDLVCKDAGVYPTLDAPSGVEVTRRTDGEHSWLFLLNHLEHEQKVELPGPGVNILTGENVKSPITIEPKGVAIIQLWS